MLTSRVFSPLYLQSIKYIVFSPRPEISRVKDGCCVSRSFFTRKWLEIDLSPSKFSARGVKKQWMFYRLQIPPCKTVLTKTQ